MKFSSGDEWSHGLFGGYQLLGQLFIVRYQLDDAINPVTIITIIFACEFMKPKLSSKGFNQNGDTPEL